MAQELIQPTSAGPVAGDAVDPAALQGVEPPQQVSWLWMAGKVLAAVLIVLLLPHFVTDQFYLYSLTTGALYLIAALGLNLTISGGIISIGTAAFLMVGGYTVALTQVNWNLNPVLATLMAAAICGVAGFVTAFPALKLGPFAVAVVTLMYANVVIDLALHFTSFTGGGFGVQSHAVDLDSTQLWWLVAGLAAVFMLGHRNLLRSPFGRALMMGRRSEPVAASLGISTARFKLASFAVYAALCGVAGSLFQMINGPISTESFDIGISITVLLMVVLGGEATVTGPLAGAFVLTLIPLILSQAVSGGGPVRQIIYGCVLLAVVLIVPGGLAAIGRTIKARVRRLTARKQQDAATTQATTRTDALHLDEFSEAITRIEEPVALDIVAMSKAIGGLQILREISFTVEPATIHGLIGPNGSGKTTLLNCVSGLTKLDSGEVRLGDQKLPSRAAKHARAGNGRTFQRVLLSEADSVRDNLLVGVDAERRIDYVSYTFRAPWALKEMRRMREDTERWASALGLAPVLDRPVSSLTPRQRRLVEIGRALSTHPKVMLLDEPAAGMTGPELEELETLIKLMRSAGITVLLVEHHADLVMRLCDRVTVIDVGRVLITDLPAVVSRDPGVVAAYLGDELTAAEV
jgi:ABC-type branched-subunit amino acid transport system ATPase component/ABC-type branched-subunit amino acid transport system permease subunit